MAGFHPVGALPPAAEDPRFSGFGSSTDPRFDGFDTDLDPRFSGFDTDVDPRFAGSSTGINLRTGSSGQPFGPGGSSPLTTDPGGWVDPALNSDVALEQESRWGDGAPLAPGRRRSGRRRRRRLREAAKFEERPYARLGFLWAVLLVVALVLGPAALALLAAPLGAIAAAAALRLSRRDRSGAAGRGPAAERANGLGAQGEHPHANDATADDQSMMVGRSAGGGQARTAVLAGVAIVPFVAIAGPVVAVAGAVAVVVGAIVVARPVFACSPAAAGFAVGAPLAATTALVVARGQGFAVALVLVSATCLYDAASRLMGRGPTGGFLGMFFGLATMGVLGFLVVALSDPPFGGAAPWAMCVMAGVLSWVGTKLCRLFLRNRPYPPALGRLDSLVVTGPVWVVVVANVLHR